MTGCSCGCAGFISDYVGGDGGCCGDGERGDGGGDSSGDGSSATANSASAMSVTEEAAVYLAAAESDSGKHHSPPDPKSGLV
jgi:hypothetical protein